MADLVMPRLSDSMEEGTILQWLKQLGDEVAVGDELVEIETDKANMAYESDIAGTLVEILAKEGETLPIGTPIARIGDSGEGSEGSTAGPVAVGDPPPLPVAKASSGEVPPTTPPAGEGAEAGEASSREGESEGPDVSELGEHGDRVKASPVARRMAREKGLELSAIEGSGPGGRIVKADVKKAAKAAPAEQPAVEAATDAASQGSAATEAPETAKGQTTYEEPSKLQATIARRMAESKATAPHFYLTAEIDMSKAVEARERIKSTASDSELVPSFNDMVVKACALALREHPRANGAYRDGRFELYSRVNVGVAVSAQDALVVPTVFDADRKGLRQIAEEARAVAARVRDGQITPPELSGATFTVSNLGMFGIDSFSAVINPPQAAILAVGTIKERPVIRGGEVAAAHLMSVNLACDHRILYGADGARFLARIRELLEDPVLLAL
jgi:pyruvate dehydrogenase E2 component (dihydrolipoamide acetyltransferase)